MTGDRDAQILVLAKAPVPGRVKTRLTPPYSPTQAAALAHAALCDTLRAVAGVGVRRKVLVLDGDPADLPLEGIDLAAQRAGGLDERLADAVCCAFDSLPLPVLLVGMDTPQVTTRCLDHAVAALLEPGCDGVLGPASDGGFWAIGLREPRPEHVVGVPMSRPDTGRRQLAALTRCGMRITLLPTMRDVDDEADAAAVARSAPGSQFAAVWSRVTEGAA